MRILVAYYSQTGNTEKVAKEIFDEVSKNTDSSFHKLNEVNTNSLADYDLIFIGSPCHSADLAPPVKKFLEDIPESPNFKLAGFVTHATYVAEGSDRRIKIHDKWAGKCLITFQTVCRVKQIDFLGFFNCMGKPSASIEAFIAREIITTKDEWGSYIKEVTLHPDNADLENARAFSRSVLEQLT